MRTQRLGSVSPSKLYSNRQNALADTYRELYAPVNKFIETRALAKDKFQLNFEVGIVDSGFEEKFFRELISQGVAGTFCGVESGSKALKAILAKQGFNTESGAEAFLNEMMDALHKDQRLEGKPTKVSDQLRKGKTVLSLYGFIFSIPQATLCVANGNQGIIGVVSGRAWHTPAGLLPAR